VRLVRELVEIRMNGREWVGMDLHFMECFVLVVFWCWWFKDLYIHNLLPHRQFSLKRVIKRKLAHEIG
jgi:hypothetical protein